MRESHALGFAHQRHHFKVARFGFAEMLYSDVDVSLDVLFGIELGLLGKVAHAHLSVATSDALVLLVDASEDSQQSALARPVGPD